KNKTIRKGILTIFTGLLHPAMLLVWVLTFHSCGDSDPVAPGDEQDEVDDPNIPGDTGGIVIPEGTTDTLLYFKSIFDSASIPVKVIFPPDMKEAGPAVVVLHGS